MAKNNNKIENQLKEEILANIQTKLNQISRRAVLTEDKYLGHNIFKILRIENFEIRHSNFFAWLLDNKNNGYIGESILSEFLGKIKRQCLTKKEWRNYIFVIDNLINSLGQEEYLVKREDKYMDILLEFEKSKSVIVIENKLYSKEHTNQLKRYYDEISTDKKYHDYDKLFIYLTLNGNEPAGEYDKHFWINISYVEILEILKNFHKNKKESSSEIDIYLNNYIEILNEKTEKTMDRIEEYFKLYEKNKNEILEMMEYIPNIKQRANKEKEYVTANKGLTLLSKNANTFLDIVINELVDIFRAKSLPENFIHIELSNDPYHKFNVVFRVLKINDIYKNFTTEFNKCFNKSNNPEKNGAYRIFYTKTLASNTKKDGYITEKQFQEKIVEELKEFFENETSDYFKIIDFIKKYNFD